MVQRPYTIMAKAGTKCPIQLVMIEIERDRD